MASDVRLLEVTNIDPAGEVSVVTWTVSLASRAEFASDEDYDAYLARRLRRCTHPGFGDFGSRYSIRSLDETQPTIVVEDTLTADLEALVAAFVAAEPSVDLWRRWPEVTDDEDDLSDTWACEQVSAAFAAFANAHGIAAEVVHGLSVEPDVGPHAWVRLTDLCVDVDWTARQFHNVSGRDWILDCRWPLVWSADAEPTHPVIGPFVD